MNPAFRRLFALAAVFIAAFIAVSAMRGGLRGLLPGFLSGEGQFRPERGDPATEAPLKLSDVELLSRLNAEYAKITRAVVPAVVSINTEGVRTEQLYDMWGRMRIRRYPTQGQGSGVIVTYQGHVVTNHHVIAGQQKIQVTLHDGKTHPAELIGEDTLLDIAVLKIKANMEFTPLKLGDSSETQVGQMVFAVGNPFGLGETVTQGIISAKERSLSDNQRDLFQTDAAINPGNSGGPLVNLRGEIIGINVAIFSPDKANPGFQGVGFSIPSNEVRESLDQILKRGKPIRGYLGVEMRDLDPYTRAALNYDGQDGTLVRGVLPSSPAQASGLQAGDVVRTFNGESIRTYTQLFALVQRTRVGDTVTLGVWRNGKSLELKVKITESGASGPVAKLPEAAPDQGRYRDPEEILQAMGIEVRDVVVAERLRGLRGVVVTGVAENGLAAGKVQAGDLIIFVNNARISGAGDFFNYLAASAAVQDTALVVFREGKSLRVTLPALPRRE
jgi:serine protease Do